MRINTALANVVALRTPSPHLPAKAGANHLHPKAQPASPPLPNRSHLHNAAGGRHAEQTASPPLPNRSHLHNAVGGRDATQPASPPLPNRSHLHDAAGGRHAAQPASPPLPNRSHLHDAAGGRHAAQPASPQLPNRSHLHNAAGGRHATQPAAPQLPSLSLRDGAMPGEHKSARPLSPTQGLKRPRQGGATVANQAPTRPSRPVPLLVNTGDPASLVYAQIDLASLPKFQSANSAFTSYEKTLYATLQGATPLPAEPRDPASLVYAQIDVASLPRYQSANGAFTSSDKTLYATLQSPAPTDTAVSRAPQERVLSWYDFGTQREKHTAFVALSARVKQLVGDRVVVCKVAPPADELDKTFIWSDNVDHYQVRLRHNPHAMGLDNLEDLAEVLDTWQKN
ncbi:hypothetical protein [Candidatus Sodalis sp. SoCistrobi]|uniref:hypothetical protein n=1 Tax=Candidatus Sodalis sp. SoCistrobi TaxID=1922216 RepID=UPI00093D17B8|nr:hypothetical protein [Candidatus Sodalis sp. SoCistrobi]